MAFGCGPVRLLGGVRSADIGSGGSSTFVARHPMREASRVSMGFHIDTQLPDGAGLGFGRGERWLVSGLSPLAARQARRGGPGLGGKVS